ncbi:hypothetical protein HW555_001513 [Spodoptera exigua]|uniref:Uncharacterized protein n=1 Tax=Spodoptera exigua TaxID=7107 RepID=A0A835GQH8_SPOEX|nr:hypothetical protein HW555_001513 [Spodoptera exigua]
MSFEQEEKSAIAVIDTSEEREFCNNSIEVIRKCPQQDAINTSWDRNIISSHENNKTPPFVSIMGTDDLNSSSGNATSSSTQTEPFVTLPVNCSFVDVSLSFSKDFNVQESTSNETLEQSVGSKRYRRDSSDGENKEMQPWKKKCSGSCSSSTSDLTDPQVEQGPPSSLSSNSDTSFKSINSNHSFKVRKRRLKSESNLFREALQRSRRGNNFIKHNFSENPTPGGTPRKERNHRRNSKPKTWKIVDLCAWIGRKGYQSITGLYSDILREPLVHQKNNENTEELRELRIFLKEVDKKQERLAQENEILKEGMKMMMQKIEQLEGKIRCGSAPPRIVGPRLAITPQDIANVKLRKTRDNPVRAKPDLKQTQQPLVTQQMLQSTRAKLGRARPVASSTPKQLLSELEKCLLQESTVSSLYRRRVARNTFRSAEELRPRPYPAARCSRSPLSPRSPRSNSIPRVKPMSPLKFPNGTTPNNNKLNT